jgi:hypothetical protein
VRCILHDVIVDDPKTLNADDVDVKLNFSVSTLLQQD